MCFLVDKVHLYFVCELYLISRCHPVICLLSTQPPPTIYLNKEMEFFSTFLPSPGGSNPAWPYPNPFPNPAEQN